MNKINQIWIIDILNFTHIEISLHLFAVAGMLMAMPKSILRIFKLQVAVKGSQSEKGWARRLSSTLCVWTVTVLARSGWFLSTNTLKQAIVLKGTVHTILSSEQWFMLFFLTFTLFLFFSSVVTDVMNLWWMTQN